MPVGRLCILLAALALLLFMSIYSGSESFFQIANAQEHQDQDQALLLEGEPGFKKPVQKDEEEKIDKPKIADNVQNYFYSMSNLLVIAGIVLLGIGISVSVNQSKRG